MPACVYTQVHTHTLQVHTSILCTVTFRGSAVNKEAAETIKPKNEDLTYSSLEATCTDITQL